MPAGMYCSKCAIEVTGEFETTLIARLPYTHQVFIEMVVLSGGNLKRIQSNTGLSYPTLRKRFDKVIATLERLANSNESRDE